MGGWTLRHRVAYDIQIPRGRLLPRSIPPAEAVPLLAQTLREDPSVVRRVNAAASLASYRDEAGAASAMLVAFGDHILAVQDAAWKSFHDPSPPGSGQPPRSFAQVPVQEIMQALRGTRMASARRELFAFVAKFRGEGRDEAARFLLAHDDSEAWADFVLYDLGAPVLGRSATMRSHLDLPRTRAVVRAGLRNPNPNVKAGCLAFLVLLGGDGLEFEDQAWVECAASDPVLLGGLLSRLYADAEILVQRKGASPDLQYVGPELLRHFLDALVRQFGWDFAHEFTQAGAEDAEWPVPGLCMEWLDEHPPASRSNCGTSLAEYPPKRRGDRDR